MPKTRHKKKQPNPYNKTRSTVKQLAATWADEEEKDNCMSYNGNHPRKKSFANFANLEAFANVFLLFLSQLELLYNEIT